MVDIRSGSRRAASVSGSHRGTLLLEIADNHFEFLHTVRLFMRPFAVDGLAVCMGSTFSPSS